MIDERQEGADLQEQTERYLDAQQRAEQAAWNCMMAMRELERIESETSTAWSKGLRDIIDAIDKARAELGGVK